MSLHNVDWENAAREKYGSFCALSTGTNLYLLAFLWLSETKDKTKITIPIIGIPNTVYSHIAEINEKPLGKFEDWIKTCARMGFKYNGNYHHPDGYNFFCTSCEDDLGLSVVVFNRENGHLKDKLAAQSAFMKACDPIKVIQPLKTLLD